MIAELTEGDKGLLKVRLNGGLSGVVIECDREMGEVQSGSVRCLHDLAVGNADTQPIGSGHFVGAGGGTGDESAGAAGI